MLTLVTQHADPTSGWDIATALGTVAAAIATVAAIVAALVVATTDRRAADKAITEQMEAARNRQSREHEIELLLSINGQLARFRAYPGAPQQAEAQEVLRGLKHALPRTPTYAPLVESLDFRVFNTTEAQRIAADLIREVSER